MHIVDSIKRCLLCANCISCVTYMTEKTTKENTKHTTSCHPCMITHASYLYSKNVKKRFPTRNFLHFTLFKKIYLSKRDYWISLRYLFYFSFYKTLIYFHRICILNGRFLSNISRYYVSTMSIVETYFYGFHIFQVENF